MHHLEVKRRIGIDFDNTIIGYQQAFLDAAKTQRLLPVDFVGTKQAVRDCIRLLPDGERKWMRLQGFIYGQGIGRAVMIDGVDEFLRRCRERNDEVFIVSHKTEFGHFDPSGVSLRQAALDWMDERGFFRDGGYGLAVENVFFEGTRSAKLERIAALGCTHFIDDLEEVLCDPEFPPRVKKILFTGGTKPPRTLPFSVCPTWAQIEELVFNARA
jgi:hypothetical protein